MRSCSELNTAKRLGWVLEKQGVDLRRLERLVQVPIKGYRKLDPTGPPKGHLNRHWMILENLPGKVPMRPLRTRLQQARNRHGIPWNVLERDYILSWILAGIYQVPVLHETLVFKGVTRLGGDRV